VPEPVEVEVIEAEEYLERAKAKSVIRYGGDRAFYYTEGDYIQLPLKSQFTSFQGYYETFFHEIGQWTGQSGRLNRNLCIEQIARAREELVAEMFAGFALHRVGLDAEIKNIAAYVQSWMKTLENDKKTILWASREAKKAVQYFESGVIPDSNNNLYNNNN
jgi:antirestriction protein ArdC